MPYQLTEEITVAAPGRRLDPVSLDGGQRRYLDRIDISAILTEGKDEPSCLFGIDAAYPSSMHVTVSMTLDDLDALRHAITRLLVKVQAETDTPPTTSVDMPAAAVGMVPGIPTPTVSIG
jgi:hypothetical protein